MMARRASLAAILVGLSASASAQAPVAPPGAAACSGCHAPARLGSPVVPINGRPAPEIVQAMQEFRSGQRPATVMDRIAKGFSDDETRAIAAWLAAQR